MKTLALFLTTFIITISLVVSQNITKENYDFPVLKGQYLGQKTPGITPELFAPGIISNGLQNRDVAISPDGNEMHFGLHTSDFKYSTIIDTTTNLVKY